MTIDPAQHATVLVVVLVVCIVGALLLLRRLVVRKPAAVAVCVSFFVTPVLVLYWRSLGSGQVLQLIGMWLALLVVVLSAASLLRALLKTRV